MRYTTYVGSLTDDAHPLGIHVLESDAETGDFRVLSAIDGGMNPSYMALSRDGRHLYSTTGRSGFGEVGAHGGLAAYELRGEKGEKLHLINCVPTGHTPACHISLSPEGKTLVWAEYSHATAGCVELAADGSISAEKQMVQHLGDGPNKPRQDKAHAHCAIVTPDSRYQLVVDLGLDQIKAYDFQNRANGLTECPKVTIRTVPPGAGPRHAVFQKNGKFLYVIFELLNYVASYRYTGEGFELVEMRTLIADPKFNKDCKASAIKLSEDGTQLFCSNRDMTLTGRDTITVFNVDPDTGRMEFLSESAVGGRFPRDFAFMPGGRFALVGLKRQGQIGSYAYDGNTGKFTLVKKMDGFHRPLYFAFRTAWGQA